MVPAWQLFGGLGDISGNSHTKESQFYARIIQLQQRRKPVRQFTSYQLFAACWMVLHAAGCFFGNDAFGGQTNTLYQPG